MVKKPTKTAKKTKTTSTPKAAKKRKTVAKVKTAKKTTAKVKTTKKSVKKKVTAAKPKGKISKPAPKTTAKKTKAVQKPKATTKKKPAVKAATRKKSGMSPREKKIQDIKLKLFDQRKALLDEAMAALNELPEQTVFPDLGDQASAEIDRTFMLRLRGRERKLLKKIETAIERIDSISFGICDKCGEPIDIRRLEARPVTTMCIECKTLQEEEEKLREK